MDKDIFIAEEKKLAETICRIDEEEKWKVDYQPHIM